MAKVEDNKEYNTFVQGLITEANPINSPTSASKDESNFVLRRDGSRDRRLGMAYEANWTGINVNVAESTWPSITTGYYLWRGPNNDTKLNIHVLQIGRSLWFFDANKEITSANALNGGAAFGIFISDIPKFSFAAVAGDLVLSTGTSQALVLQYNATTDTITSTEIDIEVRDIWGVDDGLDVTTRPNTLTLNHAYNLRNQGWSDRLLSAAGATFDVENSTTPPGIYDGLWEFQVRTGDYPSNADIYSVGINDADSKKWDPDLVQNEDYGTSKAPKGRYIIRLFDRSTARLEHVSDPGRGTGTITTDTSIGGFNVVQAYAGRIFYSGFNVTQNGGDAKSPLLGNYVAFSQIVDNIEALGKCHQEADPTSSEQSDIIASDGGTIKISGANNIVALRESGRTLVVFASNGIWTISGGPDNIFSAAQFEVQKISEFGTDSPDSIVDTDGGMLYWGDGGIYALVQDKVSLGLRSQNISENSVQTFFNAIDSEGASKARGVYDQINKTVHWLYCTDGSHKCVNELVFDTVLNAFYPKEYQRNTGWPWLQEIMVSPKFLTTNTAVDVTVSGTTVTVSSIDVTVTEVIRQGGSTNIKYMIVLPTDPVQITFGIVSDPDFVDFKEFDAVGLDASAHAITWNETLDETQRNKQAKYITTSFRRTETGFTGVGSSVQLLNPSGCLVTPYWDYADSTTGGKTGTQFQAYRLGRLYTAGGSTDPFDYGQDVVANRSKLRGRGKSLSLKFETEAGKDCRLLGWGVNYTGSSVV